MHLAFLPFRLQPPIAPYHRFSTLPLSLIGFLLPFFSSKVWASPFPSRLTVTIGRIEFVVLRTSFSPPVAPHHTSQCRSYVRLQVWKAFYLKGIFTPLALRTFRRTRSQLQLATRCLLAVVHCQSPSGDGSYQTVFENIRSFVLPCKIKPNLIV